MGLYIPNSIGGAAAVSMRGQSVERILGVVEGRRPGRTVVAIGGMHGNEPAGLDAVRTVLRELSRHEAELTGKLVGVAGNLQAIAVDRRYLERDLNRGWTPQSCQRVAKPRPDETPEDAEQRGLLEVFGSLEAESPHPLVFIDLHTTSGPAAPFSIIPDVARNRELALPLPIPTVLGLEEILDGVMFGYLVDRGHMGVAVEGGQHEDPRTTALLEAVIWLTLVEAGNLDARLVPGGIQAQRERLMARSMGLPPGVRILQRHGTSPGDGFEMEPGFDNFSPVRKGQRVARDNDGPIFASEDGLIMLPRYQGQGGDGFFLAKAITRRWLMASSLARKGGPERLLAAWPRLHWDASNPNRLRYDGTEPPAPMLRTLRLLGYHGVRARPPGLEFFRRRP